MFLIEIHALGQLIIIRSKSLVLLRRIYSNACIGAELMALALFFVLLCFIFFCPIYFTW